MFIETSNKPIEFFKTPFVDAFRCIKEQSKFDKLITIFWLLGPFVLLVERSPADAWLTLLSLAFIFRTIYNNEYHFLKTQWVSCTLIFWTIALISALLSSEVQYSAGEAVIWIRFPIYAAACAFWLSGRRELLSAMLLSTGSAMVLMCFILLVEFSIFGFSNGRLGWPYGDYVTGNYLAKASMPAFCVLIVVFLNKRGWIATICASVICFTLIMSFLTGERMNFLLRLGALLLILVVFSSQKKQGFLFVAILFSLIALVAFPSEGIIHRYFLDFFAQLPIHSDSPYLRVWMGGVEAFLSKPLIGIGPDNYRLLCSEISGASLHVDCHTHPHNFFVQILAETGFVGLLAGVAMMLAIILHCWSASGSADNPYFGPVAFVVPLVFFFPIQSTADFFGQWNNVFMWSALGLALSVQKTSNFDKKQKSAAGKLGKRKRL